MKKENTKTQSNHKDSNVEIIEIHKFCDKQGVAFRNKADDESFIGPDNAVIKSSKYGVSPSVFYDPSTQFKNDFTEIKVVNSFIPSRYDDLAARLTELAKEKSEDALFDFDNTVEKIKLTSEMNITAAKVNSLRLLTKAMIIEKNHHEQTYERKCHEETIKNISILKDALLNKNVHELAHTLKILRHEYEVELRNNDYDLERTKIMIEEKREINLLKRKMLKQQIKDAKNGVKVSFLSSIFKSKLPRDLVDEIKNKKYITPVVEVEDKATDAISLSKHMSKVEVSKLSTKEKQLWSKFTQLVKFAAEDEKFAMEIEKEAIKLEELEEKVFALKANTINAINSQHVVAVTKDVAKKTEKSSTKKLLNAKKQTLLISEPITLYAAPTATKSANKTTSKKESNIVVKTESIIEEKPEKLTQTVGRDPLSMLEHSSEELFMEMETFAPNTKSMLSDEIFQDSILEFQNIQGNDNQTIEKLNYQTIEYTNYHWEWSDSKAPKTDILESIHDSSKNHEVTSPSDDNEEEFVEKTPFQWKKLNVFSKSARESKFVRQLQEDASYMLNDPVYLKNKKLFGKENLNVDKVFSKLMEIDTYSNYEQNEQNEITIDETLQILDFYGTLASDEESVTPTQEIENLDENNENQSVQTRESIQVQKLQDKLNIMIQNQDADIAESFAQAIADNEDAIIDIKERYAENIEDAKNKALLNKEEILEQEQENYISEEETYLWNSCYHYKTSNVYLNNQFKFQNDMISDIISKVEKFNKRHEEEISLASIPSKILPLPLNSSARIDIEFEKIGNENYAISTSTEHKKELLSKIVNEEIPNEVSKVYILDKFRAVKDVKTRVALLNKAADLEYVKAINSNKERIDREMAKAKTKLNASKKEIAKIYDEVDILNNASEKLVNAINDREWTQNEFERAKDERWAEFDKRAKFEAKQKRIQERAEELALMKQEKARNRAEAIGQKYSDSQEPREKSSFISRMSFFKSNKNKVDIDEIIGKK
ncbi:MAG: hypothetical protein ACRC4L_00550 [Mycoplasma sp.]